MNKWIFSGNLVKDPEQRTVGDSTVTTFTVAVTTGYGDKKKTEFPRVSLWGARGAAVMRFCHKGSKVTVVGELETNEYEGRDGVKHFNLNVRGEEADITFDNKSNDSASAPARTSAKSLPESNDEEDELPF